LIIDTSSSSSPVEEFVDLVIRAFEQMMPARLGAVPTA
jgi:hypothetical protein